MKSFVLFLEGAKTEWTTESIKHWSSYTQNLNFKTEEEARDWLHRWRERNPDILGLKWTESDIETWSRNAPVYKFRNQYKIGEKPGRVVTRFRGKFGLEPDELPRSARAPKVDWYKPDLEDGNTRIAADHILRHYGSSFKTVKVYRAWVPVGDMPEPRLVEVDYGDEGGYDWRDFSFSGSFPPVKLEIMPSGKSRILDGNHRTKYWTENNYDYIPCWVIDRRPGRKQVSESFLTELLDKPLPWRWVIKTYRHWIARFVAPNGLVYDVDFSYFTSQLPHKIGMGVELSFGINDIRTDRDVLAKHKLDDQSRRSKLIGITGSGHEYDIFATVADIVRNFITNDEVPTWVYISFTAKEPSRKRLYDQFVILLKQKLPKNTFEVTEDDSWPEKIYRIMKN